MSGDDDERSARLQAGAGRGLRPAGVGRGEEAVARIDEAMSAGAQVGPQLTLFRAGLLLSAKAMALASLGRLDEAAEAAGPGSRRRPRPATAPPKGSSAPRSDGSSCTRAARVGAAHLSRERNGVPGQLAPGPLRWALGGLLFAAALARDRRWSAEAARALDALGRHPAALFDTAISRARSWEAVAEGDPERARLLLRDAAAEARSRGACSTRRRPARPRPSRPRPTRSPTASGAGRRGQGRTSGSSPTAPRPRPVATRRARRRGRAVRRLGLQPPRRRVGDGGLGGLGPSPRPAGERPGGRAVPPSWPPAARRPPPRTRRAPAAPVPLTNREREIAELAADGLPSRVIAERLYVSVRTVDNHPARIYAKLGVSSRAELARILRR